MLAFSISRRTREVGIGLALGLGTGFYFAESIESFLFGVNTRDLSTFAIVPCVLAGGRLGYLPARRAMRVDPMVASRDSWPSATMPATLTAATPANASTHAR